MTLRHTSALLVSVVLVCCSLSAQQPNAPGARLLINGANGPSFPILNIPIFAGSSATVQIQGDPNTPIILASSPTLQAPGTPLIGGLVDLNLASPALGTPFNGFASPSAGYVTDGSGSFQVTFPVIRPLPASFAIAYQALVQNAASPFGMRLTAATSVISQGGITTIPLTTLQNDNCVQFETLTRFGFLLPFYATAYSECYICSNGFITFQGPDADFTPMNSEMDSGFPRIALFWSDLSPNHPQFGGDVRVVVDRTNPQNPLLSVLFTNVPDNPIGLIGPPFFLPPIVHDAAAVMAVASGDIAILHFAATQASSFDVMVGISAGFGLDPTGAGSMDLSATLAAGPFTALPNEGLYEGFTGTFSVTGSFSTPYDLQGQKILFRAQNAGMAGASYIMLPVP